MMLAVRSRLGVYRRGTSVDALRCADESLAALAAFTADFDWSTIGGAPPCCIVWTTDCSCFIFSDTFSMSDLVYSMKLQTSRRSESAVLVYSALMFLLRSSTSLASFSTLESVSITIFLFSRSCSIRMLLPFLISLVSLVKSSYISLKLLNLSLISSISL